MNSLTIIDFDDTIFPTSWYIDNGYEYKALVSFPLIDQQKLTTTKKLVGELFQEASCHSEIVIVTMASQQWIYEIVNAYYPELVPWFQKIPIHSCRSYQCTKNEIVHHLLKIKSYQSVVSIGDSELERNAVITFNHYQLYKKSLKIPKKPSVDQLNEILIKIKGWLKHALDHPQHLDILC